MAVNRVENQHAEQTDEIDLMDYINVLWKWKKLIIIGTLLCMLIAGIVSFLLPPIYRVNTIIEIGTTGVVIENPLSLLEKIKGGVYDEKIREELNIKEADYPEIKLDNPNNTALIGINIESSKRDQSQNILEAMDELILKEHSDLIRIEKYNFSNKIKEIENNLILVNQEKTGLKNQLQLNKKNKEQIKKQIEEITSKISELEREKTKVDLKANPDSTLSLLLFSNEIQENRRYFNQLQDRLNIDLEKEEENLKSQLNAEENALNSLMLQKDKLNAQLVAFRDTRIVKKAGYHEKPVRPNKKQNIIMAGIAGFMVFIFIAFIMEYLKGIKGTGRAVLDENHLS